MAISVEIYKPIFKAPMTKVVGAFFIRQQN